jgi:hypothetical protein
MDWQPPVTPPSVLTTCHALAHRRPWGSWRSCMWRPRRWGRRTGATRSWWSCATWSPAPSWWCPRPCSAASPVACTFAPTSPPPPPRRCALQRHCPALCSCTTGSGGGSPVHVASCLEALLPTVRAMLTCRMVSAVPPQFLKVLAAEDVRLLICRRTRRSSEQASAAATT